MVYGEREKAHSLIFWLRLSTLIGLCHGVCPSEVFLVSLKGNPSLCPLIPVLEASLQLIMIFISLNERMLKQAGVGGIPCPHRG